MALTHRLLDDARTRMGASDPQGAVELLLPHVRGVDSMLANELIMQQSRARDISSRERQGVLTADAARAARQQVGFSVLSIIDDLQPRAVEGVPEDVASPPSPEADGHSVGTPGQGAPRHPEPQLEQVDAAPLVRDQVFVSYSHRDKEWLERLQRMLKPVVRNGAVDLWDDTRIRPGTAWLGEIRRALARASVAVLLVSDDFLSSDFVLSDELPQILEAGVSGELTVLWVYVSDCLYEETDIARIQAAYDPAVSLDAMEKHEQNAALKAIARAVKAAAEAGSG